MPRVSAKARSLSTSTANASPTPGRPLLPPPPRPPREAGISGVRPANGTARACIPQRGELLHSRVMSADSRDLAVVSAIAAEGYLTGVYPVQQGYLVMLAQPHYEVSSPTPQAAREQHEQLVRTLAEVGVRVVRARHLAQQAQRVIADAVETAAARESQRAPITAIA